MRKMNEKRGHPDTENHTQATAKQRIRANNFLVPDPKLPVCTWCIRHLKHPHWKVVLLYVYKLSDYLCNVLVLLSF